MYVIYINDRPLVLRSDSEPAYSPGSENPLHLVARYSGKRKTLLHYADTLEKGSPKVTSVEIVAPDLEKLWEDFKSHYRWVEAAGGVVMNGERVLFIYRRGFWDLPKGKLDDGEDARTAALREVEEETGVSDLEITAVLPVTYHTYHDRKDRRVLKPTYWYRMVTEEWDLVPQAEEDIELAEWKSTDGIITELEPLYASLRALLEPLYRGSTDD